MPFYDESNYSIDRSVGFLASTVSALLDAELEAVLLRELGVSIGQWRALTWVHRGNSTSAASLCAELRYDSGAMTRLLDRLEALDLVIRRPDETDRRAYRLHLTRKGRQVSQRGFDLARENLNRALASLSNAESEQLVGLLQAVKQTLLGSRAAPASETRRHHRTSSSLAKQGRSGS